MKNRNFFIGLALFAILLSSCNGGTSTHAHTAGTPVEENRIEATCTETGSYDLVTYCAEDHEEMSREHKTIAALGHDYQSVIAHATYEYAGYTTHTCSRCGDTYNESNGEAQLEHHYSTSWSHNESKHWHACIDSGYESLKKDESSHTFNDVVAPATYEHGGYTTHTCTVCGYTYKDGDTSALPITIIWKNYDGSVLETDTNVPFGSMPSYDGRTPTKNSDEQFSYTFDKWTPEIALAVCDATYTATFTSSLEKAYIIFDLNGGSTSSDTSSKYVSSINSSRFFFDVTKDGYNFRGWEYKGQKIFDQKGNQLFNISIEENMTFKAIFSQDVYLTIGTNMPEAGTINGEGTYSFNTQVDVSVNTNQGYVFLGWYYNGTLLSNQETYKYMMWDEDVTLKAIFKYDSYTLTVKSAHPLLGLVMIKGDYNYVVESTKVFDYKSNVTVAAYTSTDEYRFLGWYDESGDLVTTNAVYAFTMPYNDYSLFARWDAPSYNVNITKNRDAGGTITGTGPHDYGSFVTISVETNDGYLLDGIFLSDTKVGDDIYSFVMPNENVNLEVRWSVITYSITYELNGGTNSSSNPSTYNVESSPITLANPEKTHYAFNGWTFNGEAITSIPTGITGDLVLVANWAAKSYQVSVIVNDESLGAVTGAGSHAFGSSVTLTATPTSDNIFKGWYSNSELTTLLSSTNPYTFTLDSEGTTIYAKFLTKAEEEAWNIAHGVTPVYDSSTQTVTYGLYPQTNVNDSTLVSALDTLTTPESNGWYLYEGEYYAKLSSNWFKCEPIVWNVLFNNNGEYYLLSSVLLDAHCYHSSTSSRTIDEQTIYANNYEYSDIRTWLNDDFYNSAFALNNSYIQTTVVDNSASTTNYSINSYTCSSTEDKVFLPSYQDYLNEDYGFENNGSYTSSTTRECKTTNWARARDAYYSTSSSYLYNGEYWTRSPDSGGSSLAYCVGYHGYLGNSSINETNKGVRPAITLKFA